MLLTCGALIYRERQSVCLVFDVCLVSLCSADRSQAMPPLLLTGYDEQLFFTKEDVTKTNGTMSIKELPVGARICNSAPRKNQDDVL